MVCAQTRISPRKWDAQSSLEFWDTHRSGNPCQKTRLSDNHQRKTRTSRMVDRRRKNKENCRLKQVLKPCKKTKRQWTMRAKLQLIVFGALGTVPKCCFINSIDVDDIRFFWLGKYNRCVWFKHRLMLVACALTQVS